MDAQNSINEPQINAIDLVFGRVTLNGIWAIVDQAAFAGTSFFLSLFLGRWLSQSSFGTFTFVYSIFVLFGAIYTAFLTEPMLVFGSKVETSGRSQYLGNLIVIHLIITSFMAMAISFIGLIINEFFLSNTGEMIWNLAISTPGIFLLWLFRRYYYTVLRPQFSALLSILLGLSILIVLFEFNKRNALMIQSVFPILAILSLLISGVVVFKLKPDFSKVSMSSVLSTLTRSSEYGGWAILTAITFWFSGNQIYLALTPFLIDLQAAAFIRAISTLALPLSHIVVAISTLLIPLFGKYILKFGFRKSRCQAILIIFIMLVIGITYMIVVIYWGNDLLALFYKDKYQASPVNLFLVSIMPIVMIPAATFGSLWKAAEKPKEVLFGQLIGLSFTLFIGIALVIFFDISGVLLSMVCSSLFAGMFVMYRIFSVDDIPRK